MDYPEHPHYEVLYARYLRPGRTAELVAYCGDLRGKHLLDLCGGGGRASLEALAAGAHQVTLVDESLPMTRHLTAEPRVKVVHASVEQMLHDGAPGMFDAVICQQAIAYWFAPVLVPPLRRVMRKGAPFVFNTFWDQPAAIPTPKAYEYQGRKYLELSWLGNDGWVEHVQICEGLPPHTTRFHWIPPEVLVRSLEPYFEVQERRDGKTSVYVCLAR